jgi:hypothetical protein
MRPKPSLALVKLRATNQAHINKLFHSEGPAAAEAELRRLAQVDKFTFHGPGWLVGQASAMVEGPGATVYAKPGDIVLLAQDLAGVVSFYSVREAHSCVAGAGVKPLVGWDKAFAFWRHHEGKPEATWITAEPRDDEEDIAVRGELLLPVAEDGEEERL